MGSRHGVLQKKYWLATTHTKTAYRLGKPLSNILEQLCAKSPNLLLAHVAFGEKLGANLLVMDRHLVRDFNEQFRFGLRRRLVRDVALTAANTSYRKASTSVRHEAIDAVHHDPQMVAYLRDHA